MAQYLNPMLDKEFLKQLDNYNNKTIYARVVALNLQEYPTQDITGIVQSGNINIDGNSAIRRSCSLTLISTLNSEEDENEDIKLEKQKNSLNGGINVKLNDFYWGLNTKFQVYIGIKNEINPEYDDIIWFNMGIYLITSFSASLGVNSFSVSISGKDKMCLLNGDVGGVIPAETCFGVLKEYNDETGEYDVIDLPIDNIVKEAVHAYGKEPYYNILINDLEIGHELLEYQGKDEIYLIYKHKKSTSTGIDYTTTYYDLKEADNKCYLENGKTITLKDLDYYENLNEGLNTDLQEHTPTKFWFTEPKDNVYYTAARFYSGMAIGYKETLLTYPQAEKLTLKAGQSVANLLDQITKTFGDYEYFYNVDGQFVFQKKKTYINTAFNSLATEQDDNGEIVTYGDSAANTSSVTYSFEDGVLVTQYQNSPNLGNLKNDFICWGSRKSSSGADLPIHMRYAIDKKPEFYWSVDISIDEIENSDILSQVQAHKNRIEMLKKKKNNYFQKGRPYFTDVWFKKQPHEIQEALRKYIYAWWDNEPDPSPKNKTKKSKKEIIGERDVCGYNWREIIYQMANDYYKYNTLPNFQAKIISANNETTILKQLLKYTNSTLKGLEQRNTNIDTLYANGFTGYEQYYLDMQGFWRQIYDPNLPYIYEEVKSLETEQELYINEEFRKVESLEDYLQYCNTYPIYVVRMDSNGQKFLSPLIDSIYVQYKIQGNNWTPTGSISDYIYVNDEKTNEKIKVKNLKGLKKSDLFYKASAKVYKKLDKYIINHYNISVNTGFAIMYESKITGGVEQSNLQNLINKDDGYLYFKIDEENKINPATAYADGSFLQQLYYQNKAYKKSITHLTLNFNGYTYNTQSTYEEKNIFYKKKYKTELKTNKFWYTEAVYNPSQINFWIDFLDTTGPLNNYSTYNIGSRTKVDNNNSVKAIYYEEIPKIVFHSPDDYRKTRKDKQNGSYQHLWLSKKLESSIVLSGQGQSAKNAIDNLLYNYTHFNEQISLTAIPVYYLTPNTRIYVNDNSSGISGEYIVNKISYNLGHNGTMNISASKAVQRIN